MICVHICPDDPKFIHPFRAFVQEHLTASRHEFLFLKQGLITAIPTLRTAEKIILHGLMSRKLILFLALQPWLLHKCYWVIWGADLYNCSVFPAIKKFVISRLKHLITCIEGDVNLAREWYGAKGRWHDSFIYPSNMFKLFPHAPHDDVIWIQAGNSADPGNHHDDIFEIIKPFKNENIKIICPLTYGDKTYAQKVAAWGHDLFGDKFIPLTEFLSAEAYAQYQARIHIAIFAHKRQQAMGNIVGLLGNGRKVYMRAGTTHRAMFEKLGVRIYDMNDFNLENEIENQNTNIIKNHFSPARLKQQLQEILE